MRSLFGRIAKYPLTGTREAREDRITEVLAAVLDHKANTSDSTFAVRLAAGWLEQSDRALSSRCEPMVRDRIVKAREALLKHPGDWIIDTDTQRWIATDSGP